jgi:hypothetical protein
MTKKPRDRIKLLNSRDRLTMESLVERLAEITCAYGRERAREEYLKVRKPSQDELKRGIWRNDDLIFLEQEIEVECARLCAKWASRLEETLNGLIEADLTDRNDKDDQ